MRSEVTPDMVRALEEARAREDAFWERNGIPEEGANGEMRKTGKASEAWRAWVAACEAEYDWSGAGSARRFLDTPAARQSFILGFYRGRAELSALRQRLSAMEKVVEVARVAHDYLKNIRCEDNCDPSVGAHCPECCITRDFYSALAALDGLQPGGEK